MKYTCDACSFGTNNKYNFAKHNETVKHKYLVRINNVQNNEQNHVVQEVKTNNEIVTDEPYNKYMCPYCKFVMTNNRNMSRHLSRCDVKKKQEMKLEIEREVRRDIDLDKARIQCNKMELQRDKIQMEYECYKKITEKEKEFYELNAERDKERNAELKETIEYERVKEKSSNLSTSNYLMVNYNQAAPLLLLDNFSIFEEGDVELLELLLDAESNDEFYAFVGKALIKTYKTDDPKDQQLWNSDDDRLTYFIRRNFEWTIDKKGIKTGDLIVEPALKHFSNILKKFLNSDIPRGKHVSTDHVLADHKRRTLATKILIDVENGSIRHKVLKYIAPYLYLDKKIKCISPNEKNKLTFTEDEIYN